MIVVIGDGRDRAGDHERVTRLGVRAAKEGDPDPLVRVLRRRICGARCSLLGELSKRSLGTFRWVQRPKADSWTPAFEQLSREIAKQYVLTFFLGPDDEVAGKKLKVEDRRADRGDVERDEGPGVVVRRRARARPGTAPPAAAWCRWHRSRAASSAGCS